MTIADEPDPTNPLNSVHVDPLEFNSIQLHSIQFNSTTVSALHVSLFAEGALQMGPGAYLPLGMGHFLENPRLAENWTTETRR